MADPPKRRPGRPSLKDGEPSVNLHMRVPTSDYDEACRIAQQRGATVSDIFRAAFRIVTKRQDKLSE